MRRVRESGRIRPRFVSRAIAKLINSGVGEDKFGGSTTLPLIWGRDSLVFRHERLFSAVHTVSTVRAQPVEYRLFEQPLWNMLNAELAKRNHRTSRQFENVERNDREGH